MSGVEHVLPFYAHPLFPLEIAGEFDAVSDEYEPGQFTTWFQPFEIVKVTLNCDPDYPHQNLILETRSGVQLTWRIYRREGEHTRLYRFRNVS